MSSRYGRVTTDWFLRFAAAPRATVRLICFPHAGGGAAGYRRFAELVPDTIEVLAVQYPGRQNRYGEPVIDDMTLLADEIVGAVERELTGPVVFFGHSMGAVVAFEVARRLRGGEPVTVRRLFASAGPAPSARSSLGVHLRDDDGVVAYIRELGGSGVEMLEIDEIRQLTLPMVRGDLRLIETYRYAGGEPLNCPITAIVGDRDHTFTAADARRWVVHTTAGLDVHSLPGGHFYLDDQADRLVPLLVERVMPR
ncbi:alpha/beta fold hydrolase [Micromonospora sp. WMMD1102]|uniref:thioesterase II family protein n=1 Tax=Micromonospora sp. WMMD1102 TaxID=3016105 RepID=UPI002414F0A9|nr:alpha/beta fold hydrolase [Micromonospora sp. WMMD1102]MDG4786453.1 alpha/beta fold hydrolase [Micromonospora sp. WMMD1102]